MSRLRTSCTSLALLATFVAATPFGNAKLDEREALPAKDLVQRVRSAGGFSLYDLARTDGELSLTDVNPGGGPHARRHVDRARDQVALDPRVHP